MGSRRKFPRWLLVGFTLLLVGVIIQSTRVPYSEQRQVLKDGTQATLVGVTFDQEHRISTGNALTRLVAPLAPGVVRDSTGFGTFSRPDVPRHVPVVWLYLRRKIGSGRTLPEQPIQLWTVADEDGCETQISEGDERVHASGEIWSLKSFALHVFPRRKGRVALRAYTWTANPEPSLEFWLENPDRGPHPEWPEAPLPVAVQDGDVRYTLRRFVSSADYSDAASAPRLDNRRDASTHL